MSKDKNQNANKENQSPPTGSESPPLGMGEQEGSTGSQSPDAQEATEIKALLPILKDEKTGKLLKPDDMDESLWHHLMGLLPDEPKTHSVKPNFVERYGKQVLSLCKRDVYNRVRPGAVIEICPFHATVCVSEQTRFSGAMLQFCCPVAGCNHRPPVARPELHQAWSKRQQELQSKRDALNNSRNRPPKTNEIKAR